MRRLPCLGGFDLITCIDDALNYLLTEDDLQEALRGIARNLAPDGLAIWDLNTIAQYRGQFSRDAIKTDADFYVGWAARHADVEVAEGCLIEVDVDVFARASGACWTRSSSVHRQCHWPVDSVGEISRRAGVRLLTTRGQYPGAVLGQELDELVHTKAFYVASLA